jgi:hypothetical protein
LRNLSVLGLGLGLAGAILDFVSGTLILKDSMTAAPMMPSTFNQAALAWALVLYSLAAILAITGILGVTSAGMGRMRRIGNLMLLYGVVMIGIGGLMYGGYAPTMGGLLLSSVGMLTVGILMIANGALMSRSTTMRPMMRPTTMKM